MRLFLGRENIVIANFSMISAGHFHDVDNNDDDQNDGLWCQSSLNESTIGSWYLPSGHPVPMDGNPVESNNANAGQVGLLRNGGIVDHQGLYKCVILNEERVNETLYVAVYSTAAYNNSGKPLN